jgi:replicative DNA helicase
MTSNSSAHLFDLKAEDLLIGHCLANSDYDGLVDLSPAAFSNEANQALWLALQQIFLDGLDVSETNLAIHGGPQLQAFGGRDRIFELVAMARSQDSHEQNIRNVADRVGDLAQRRDLQRISKKLGDEAFKNPDIASVRQEAIRTIERTVMLGMDKAVSAKQIRADLRRELDSPPAIYQTGFLCLDEALSGGPRSGQLICFAAEPKVGLTMLLSGMFARCAARGVRVLYATNVISPRDIEARVTASLAGFNALELVLGNRDALREKLTAAFTAAPKDAYYLDASEWTAPRLFDALTAAHIRHGIEGYYLDKFPMIRGRDKESEESFLRRIAHELRALNRKTGMWGIVAAVINKGTSKLYQGDGIEDASDVTMQMHRDNRTNEIWFSTRATSQGAPMTVGGTRNPALVLVTQTGPFIEEWTALRSHSAPSETPNAVK